LGQDHRCGKKIVFLNTLVGPAMLFTFIALAAAPQALGLRPSATSSAMSAQFAKLRDFAKAAPSNDPTTAIQEVASVVNSIMIQAGNATAHLTAADQELLVTVIGILRDSMYVSMTSAHGSDVTELADAINAINACHATFAARIVDGGDLNVDEDEVRTFQDSLNGLQDDVDTKTGLNNTAWNNLDSHMGLISPAPECTALPHPRTMASLDVYFTSSLYVTWWTEQKRVYEPVSEAYKYANEQLELAITAYAVGLAVRNVAYCDWKLALEAACVVFSDCYEAAKARYLTVVKPGVEERMHMRIEAFKAGETIIHQIRFLLALETDQATPSINTAAYQMAFPAVPAKPACDMSALDDAAWVPTPDCDAPAPVCQPREDIISGTFQHFGADFAASSDQQCNERCQNTAGCTAWVRGRSPGTRADGNAHCWLTQQVPPVWEADNTRVAGRPGCVNRPDHTCGGSAAGVACTFPFEYQGVTYDECTMTNHHQLWCSRDAVYTGSWGNCEC